MVASAPIPANEADRLATLLSYEILDTPSDDRFDLFTRIGTWLFHVPMAAINLVDADRTFFKSLVGLAAYEPRRSTSPCAHAVGIGDAIMVVEDLAADVRFKDHPLVVAKGVRFYAGALLYSESGLALGTVCIADVKPRRFRQKDRNKLLELSKGVSAVLELHRQGINFRQAARRDALTGLYNRRVFDEKLAIAIATAQATRDGECALLYIDLDGFKEINDSLGHAAGDAMLREVGRRLMRSARRQDVVARLGGDEFVVIMSEPTSEVSAEQLARHVLKAFAEPFDLESRSVPIRSSIGIALYPAHATDDASLLRCADTALYEAKKAGRGHYQCYQHKRTTKPIDDAVHSH